MIDLDDFHFQKGHFVTYIIDVADYKVGYMFSVPFLTIFKIKTSKIMESPKYMTIIKLFGTEYIKA
jgi:hypothetical protein